MLVMDRAATVKTTRAGSEQVQDRTAKLGRVPIFILGIMLVTHEEIYEKWIKTHCSYCWRRRKKFRGLKCLLNKSEVEVFEQWDETHCSKR